MSSAMQLLIAKLDKKYTKVIGKPKARDIMELKKEMMGSALKIPNSKAPKLGHVGMMMTGLEYSKLAAANGKAWEPPECDLQEPRKKKKESDPAFERRLKSYEKEKEEKAVFEAGSDMMIKHFFDKFEPMYTKPLQLDPIKEMNLTPLHCYDYMADNFGVWTSAELSQNKKRLTEPWDERGSIDTLIDRIEDVMDCGEKSGHPIDIADVVLAVIEQIEGKQDFVRALDEINRVDPDDWDWNNVKTALKLAEKSRSKNTMADKGYHGANAATKATKPEAETTTRRGKLEIDKTTGLATRKTTIYQGVYTFCHSCGVYMEGADDIHDSSKCKKRKPDHDELATPTMRNNGNSTDIHWAERTLNRKRTKREGGGNGKAK
jgi:hypothetical protein